MSKNTLLVILTATGSALCWWPAIIEPRLNFSPLILFALIALITALSTILSQERSMRFAIVSIVGTIIGLLAGFVFFPWSDGIARSYIPVLFIFSTLAAYLVSLATALAVRKMSVTDEAWRRTLWIILICAVSLGPLLLALTPWLIARRVGRDDRVAAERFIPEERSGTNQGRKW